MFVKEAHREMAVIGRAFRLLVPRRRRPGTRQIVQAVPMNPRRAPDQQLGGTLQAPALHLFGAEARSADLRYPYR